MEDAGDAGRVDDGGADGATDPDDGSDGPGGPDGPDSLKFDRWRRASATGAVMTGIALGLREALQVPREEPAIVEQVSGDPPGPPQPLEVHLDPDSPGSAVAVVRPWLMQPKGGAAGATDTTGEPRDGDSTEG